MPSLPPSAEPDWIPAGGDRFILPGRVPYPEHGGQGDHRHVSGLPAGRNRPGRTTTRDRALRTHAVPAGAVSRGGRAVSTTVTYAPLPGLVTGPSRPTKRQTPRGGLQVVSLLTCRVYSSECAPTARAALASLRDVIGSLPHDGARWPITRGASPPVHFSVPSRLVAAAALPTRPRRGGPVCQERGALAAASSVQRAASPGRRLTVSPPALVGRDWNRYALEWCPAGRLVGAVLHGEPSSSHRPAGVWCIWSFQGSGWVVRPDRRDFTPRLGGCQPLPVERPTGCQVVVSVPRS